MRPLLVRGPRKAVFKTGSWGILALPSVVTSGRIVDQTQVLKVVQFLWKHRYERQLLCVWRHCISHSITFKCLHSHERRCRRQRCPRLVSVHRILSLSNLQKVGCRSKMSLSKVLKAVPCPLKNQRSITLPCILGGPVVLQLYQLPTAAPMLRIDKP